MRRPHCSKAVKPQSGYAFLASVLDQVDVTPICAALLVGRRMGRPGYPVEAMLRGVLVKFILNIRYTNQLVVRLRENSRLQEICGFTGQIPTESTFSRFLSRLDGQTALLKEAGFVVLKRLKQDLPDLGEIAAIDSTSVETFSNPNRTVVSDPDARWGLKYSAKSKDGKTVYFFGYKVHLIADAVHGLPLSYSITTGNVGDTTQLAPVVNQTFEEHPWVKMSYLLADRGYDSQRNHEFLDALGVTPIIHIRRPTAADQKHGGVYDKRGAPTCMGGESMQFVHTDLETGHHLFRCPDGGCPLKTVGSKPIIHWEDPSIRYQDMGGPGLQSQGNWQSSTGVI